MKGKFKSLRHFRTIGSVTPSSGFLIEKMLKGIDFESAGVIVEFGVGNGCITKEILKKLNVDGRLISFEINDEFCRIISTEINDARFILIQKSAEEITNELYRLGIEKVDYIISSLPLTFIPELSLNNIFVQSKNLLSSNGVFLQYQYSLANYSDLKKYFNRVIKKIELRNIPPAVIYQCSNT